MWRRQRLALVVFGGMALLGIVGCKSATPSKRAMTANEPPLTVPGEPQPGAVADKPASGSTAFVDRHPLLYKPKQMYDKSGDNKVVKVAGATLVGVPMGILGELRQIVVGRPPAKPL